MTAEFTVGQSVGDYEVLSILGLGGMGKVYKVRNVISDRAEAMKVLLPDLNSHQSLADRFLREIRLLASLNHPNIAALRTALTYENQLVMIMEFVEGETLANRIARAPISTAEAVNYSEQILSALSYAHKHNIIHRDIKPANMMLTPQGAVKLMDFGIARSGTDGSLTSTGTTLGSLNYMPPEQVRGEAADARSDLYSFGISLYELLTGKLPFQGDSQYSLMTAQLNQKPASPISLRADVPPALNEIILMAMAKEPSDRFQSADAFANALKSVPVSALPSQGTTFAPTPRPSTPVSPDDTLMGTLAPGAGGMGRMVSPPATTQAAVRVPVPPPAAAQPRSPSAIPTVPMAPAPAMAAAAESAPAAYPPPPARSSSRGLWLAIGSLLGAGVLIAAGVYIPRRMKTHADPEQSNMPTQSTADSTAKPGSGTDAPVSVTTSAGSVAVDGQGNVSVQAPGVSVSATPDGNVNVTAPGTSVHAGTKPKADGNPKPLREGGASGQATAPPVPAGPSPEEIAKMEDEADRLNIRAATAARSVDTLRQQQQAAGYNLRGDIASAAERMQMYIAKGDAALKAKDMANAQKYYDLADAEISKVEKFLGH
ncbi:MAG TPA: serine/threonine-protein kinase [Candidatus Acidoferrum sp.]|jgi:serine/threonine-protein kinase|nr:serine/threonine-protein kinase [Candidatus Acidoferrum sp.]